MKCGKCKADHGSVDEVKQCYMLLERPDNEGNPATGPQINFAQKLTRGRVTVDPVHDIEMSNSIEAACEFINGMDFDQIGAYISAMKHQPFRSADQKSTPLRPLVGEGMYRVNGVIYKVQRAVHGSGHLYAKRLEGERFEYAPGALNSLSPEDKMTLEECKEYGALYGVCCVCGRTLTNEQSIADGIGPICAGKAGWFAVS